MPRNRHLPGWRFLRFITIVTVYDPICNVIRIGLTSLPGGVANRLPLLQRHRQITTLFDAVQYRPPRDGAAFFLLFLWFAAAERGVLPRRGKTPLPASPRPGASRGGRKRRITLTYPPAKQENRTKPYNFGEKMGRNILYHSRHSAFFPENAENRRAGLPGDFYLPYA